MTNMIPDTACFVYRFHCSPLWVELSTLAYETNTNFNIHGSVHRSMTQ